MPRLTSTCLSICTSFLLVILGTNSSLAQENKSATAPTVSVSASAGRVRFSTRGEVYQLRLEVYSVTGRKVFDSRFMTVKQLDWDLLKQPGHSFADGTYRCVVTIRNRNGQLTRKHAGVVVRAGQVSLQTPGQDTQSIQIGDSISENSESAKGVEKRGKQVVACGSLCDDSGNTVVAIPENLPTGQFGLGNSFVGLFAGAHNKGINNSFYGREAGIANTSGGANSFFGLRVGKNNLTGSNNSFFGSNAGLSNTSENNNTFIGFNSNGFAGITNATALGANATVTCSNCLTLGNNANVGIGTPSPINTLTVNGNASFGGTSANTGTEPIEVQGPNAGISLWDRTSGPTQRWIIYADKDVHGVHNFMIRNPNLSPGAQDVFSMNLVGSAGFAGILFAGGGFSGQCLKAGSSFNGSSGNRCNMDGSANQDFAETFATQEQTQPGDVVTLITRDQNKPAVRKSLGAYDEYLLGVVSTNPGLVFDEGKTRIAGANDRLITKDKTPVAAIGRVPVRFTLENGAIQVGDPLTSSATIPGAAMKATQAGKIIGYALENSAKAKDGKLIMWIQVGYYLPPQSQAWIRNANAANREMTLLKEQNQLLHQRNAELEVRLAALEQVVHQMKGTPQARAQLGKRHQSNE